MFAGARLGGTSAYGKSPLAIPLIIFITSQEPSNWGSKCDPLAGPPLNLVEHSGKSHTTSVHVVLITQVPNAHLRLSQWPMNLIKPKSAEGAVSPSTPGNQGIPRLHSVGGHRAS